MHGFGGTEVRRDGGSEQPNGRTAEPSNAQLALDWTLDALEARVLCTLSAHKGRAAAIRGEDLARAVGTSPRELQHVIHRLRTEHGAPIASAAAPPCGYYVIETTAEAEAYKREQYSKALGTLASTAAVLRVSMPELLGQLSLEAAR